MSVLIKDMVHEYRRAFSPVYVGAVVGDKGQIGTFLNDLTKKTGAKIQEFESDPIREMELANQIYALLLKHSNEFPGEEIILHARGLEKFLETAGSHSMGHNIIQDLRTDRGQRELLDRLGKKLMVIFSVPPDKIYTQRQLLGAQFLNSTTVIV